MQYLLILFPMIWNPLPFLGYFVVLVSASLIWIGMSAPIISTSLLFVDSSVLLGSSSLICIGMRVCLDKIKERMKNSFTEAGESTVRSSSDNDCFRIFTFLLFLFERVHNDVPDEMGV